MSEEKLSRLHAYLRGRVQGVGFRHFVMTRAGELGLTGWVRNLRDGRVEVTAEGPRSTLEILMEKLHRGPMSADVRRVDEQWGEYQGEFTGFNVRRTQ